MALRGTPFCSFRVDLYVPRPRLAVIKLLFKFTIWGLPPAPHVHNGAHVITLKHILGSIVIVSITGAAIQSVALAQTAEPIRLDPITVNVYKE